MFLNIIFTFNFQTYGLGACFFFTFNASVVRQESFTFWDLLNLTLSSPVSATLKGDKKNRRGWYLSTLECFLQVSRQMRIVQTLIRYWYYFDMNMLLEKSCLFSTFKSLSQWNINQGWLKIWWFFASRMSIWCKFYILCFYTWGSIFCKLLAVLRVKEQFVFQINLQ